MRIGLGRLSLVIGRSRRGHVPPKRHPSHLRRAEFSERRTTNDWRQTTSFHHRERSSTPSNPPSAASLLESLFFNRLEVFLVSRSRSPSHRCSARFSEPRLTTRNCEYRRRATAKNRVWRVRASRRFRARPQAAQGPPQDCRGDRCWDRTRAGHRKV
jgi:hypothetical protein